MKTARSTAVGTACRWTDPDWLARSSRASLSGPRLELSGQKIVGHSQLPDLGVQFLHLLLVNLGLLSTAALEHAGRALQQGTFPLMDHRRMHPEPARQLGGGLLALQGFQRDLRLELGSVLL